MQPTPRRNRSSRPAFDALEARSLLTIGFPGDGALDITFIGDQYTDMAQFHADVQRMSTYLLGVEPFRSRSDQIRIHEIDNTQPLGSTRDPANPRALSVGSHPTIDLVNASGIKTDFVGVLVNTPDFGGSGGGIAVSYNGADAPQVFLHEFAHTFGQLADEYIYGTTGPIDDQVHSLDPADHSLGNVYAGSPPAAQWSGIVAPDEYFLGATNNNWYRSSLSSIMRTEGTTAAAEGFNVISLRALEAKLDYWASPSADHQAPQVAIAGLQDGSTVSGVVHVAISASDDRAVTNAQLWVDGRLARNSTTAPFTLDWLTGQVAPGAHTLQVKAFDASGNVGTSAPIAVNLASGSDFEVSVPASTSGGATNVMTAVVSMWGGGADQFGATIDGVPSPSVQVDRLTGRAQIILPNVLGLAPGTHTLTLTASVLNPDRAHLLERYRATTTFTTGGTVPVQPTLDFSTPAAGATVAGTIRLMIDPAQANPRRVQYFVDGKSIGTSKKGPSFVLAWNSKKVKDGQHVLRLVATDASGATTAAQRLVAVRNVVDRKRPTVTLASPRNKAKLASGAFAVRGVAKDNVGVARVELLIDNVVVDATSASRYLFTRDASTLSPGKHRLRVRATDTSGNLGLSPIVTVVRV